MKGGNSQPNINTRIADRLSSRCEAVSIGCVGHSTGCQSAVKCVTHERQDLPRRRRFAPDAHTISRANPKASRPFRREPSVNASVDYSEQARVEQYAQPVSLGRATEIRELPS